LISLFKYLYFCEEQMRIQKVKIALHQRIALLTAMLVLVGSAIFAQKIDTTKISLKPKTKVVNNIPQIKGSVPTYKPKTYGYYPSATNANANKEKGGRILTILKIYPNPVVEQLNINLRINRDTNLSIKITDLLGNEIATLLNEKVGHGEITKTFNMPSKINSGIYFLRIVAGVEPIIKRISVL
jgi:hypothetical protein